MVLVLAATVDQATTVFDYCEAFLVESPVLKREIEDDLVEAVLEL